MKKNHYELLGIDTTASPDEIKKAFRKLAMQYHPDKNANNKAATEMFKMLNEANATLSDPEKRFEYDATLRASAPEPTPRPSQSPTKTHAAQKRRVPQPHVQSTPGRNLVYHLTVPLEDIFKGCKKTISFIRTIQGQRQSSTVVVDIPAGVVNGQKLRLRGAGESLSAKQPPGDLIVHVHYAEHPFFTVDESDLVVSVPISPLQWLLRDIITIPTLHGKRDIAVPLEDEFGKIVVQVSGLGLPLKDDKKRFGDLFVKMKVQTPPPLSDSVRAEIRKLVKLLPKSKEETQYEEFLKTYDKKS